MQTLSHHGECAGVSRATLRRVCLCMSADSHMLLRASLSSSAPSARLECRGGCESRPAGTQHLGGSTWQSRANLSSQLGESSSSERWCLSTQKPNHRDSRSNRDIKIQKSTRRKFCIQCHMNQVQEKLKINLSAEKLLSWWNSLIRFFKHKY